MEHKTYLKGMWPSASFIAMVSYIEWEGNYTYWGIKEKKISKIFDKIADSSKNSKADRITEYSMKMMKMKLEMFPLHYDNV